MLCLQSRDGILDGTHPCTQEEAIQVNGSAGTQGAFTCTTSMCPIN